ncbi:MAG: nicotinate-nucleotide adenylyltransferase [Pontibacterium sp.]
MTSAIRPVYAFMGGTFDPVHIGHLRSALEIGHWLGAQEIRLVPSRVPVHKQGVGASAQARCEMLQLAVADEPSLYVDLTELESAQDSYTVHTLQLLREQLGADASICFVMGMDSYLSLPTWKAWQSLLDFCHIIVVKRPGYPMPDDELMLKFTQQFTQNLAYISEQPSGGVLIKELTPLAISSTQVRNLVAQGQSPRYLVPDNVWNFIRQNGLYGYNL